MLRRRGLVSLAAVFLAGCAADPAVVFESAALKIQSVGIGPANVFVIDRSGKRLMIDSGNPGEEAEIEERMRQLGIEPSSIDYLIVTHGHIDHAGTAAYFQKQHGVKVVGGRADLPIIERAGRAALCPTSTLARAIRWLRSGMTYTPFSLDVPIDGDYDLSALGVDGQIYSMPGHTPGSLVVAFDDQVFVGDLIRGGIVSAETPTTHFYQCDLADNRAKIRSLVDRRELRRWYPGHFGPFAVDDVEAYLADLD